MSFVIGAPCLDVKDMSCVEQCPVDCIYEGDRKLYIHPDECIDCGACEATCPVEAIAHERAAPAEEIADTRKFFESIKPAGDRPGQSKSDPTWS